MKLRPLLLTLAFAAGLFAIDRGLGFGLSSALSRTTRMASLPWKPMIE